MMKLTRPKSGTSNLFYVSSESGGETHIVVKVGPLAFCDCKNFMVRQLPKIGTSTFAPCKHGEFVLDSVKSADNVGYELLLALRDEAKTVVGLTATKVASRIEQLHQRARNAYSKL